MKTFIILLFLSVLYQSSLMSQSNDNEVKIFHGNPDRIPCVPEIKFDPAIHKNSPTGIADNFPAFAWPLEYDLDNGIVLVNYVDDQSSSSIVDYMGNSWAYNGHNGTDLSLHSFRDMDRLVGVKAGAAGTVEQIVFSNYDRNTSCTGTANIVLIRHDDGSYAYYYHLMRNSVTVKLGEYVQQGKIIGYVGSSGCSTDAHLHFECGNFVGGTWYKRDPWNGTYNTLPSLWQSQEAYVGSRNFKAHDMGVFTEASVGSINNVTYAELKERIIDPHTVSGYEPEIGVWMLLQGLSGQAFQIEFRKPNGTLYTSVTTSFSGNAQYSWVWWTPNFNVGIDETGNWYARVLYSGLERMRVYFNVQLLTSTRPRLYPEAARFFRKSLFVQKDTLRVRPVRTNMEYELVNPPPGVTLTNDSIITIPVDNTFRTRQFKVIASMGGSSTLRDTMVYFLIDTTKNHSTGNGIVSLQFNGLVEGLFNGTTMVSDTVNIQLRSAVSPYFLIDQDEVKLSSSGYAIANFPDASSGTNYYIVVKHRNSIETWSAGSHNFPNGFPYTYNFSTSSGQAYGNNLKFKNFKYCFYSGDANQDFNVDVSDLIMIFNDLTEFTFGYVPTDLDGDEFVDAADLTIAYNNSKNFVTRIRP